MSSRRMCKAGITYRISPWIFVKSRGVDMLCDDDYNNKVSMMEYINNDIAHTYFTS